MKFLIVSKLQNSNFDTTKNCSYCDNYLVFILLLFETDTNKSFPNIL